MVKAAIKIPNFDIPEQKGLVYEVATRYNSTLQRSDKGGTKLNAPSYINTSRTRNIPLRSKAVINKEGLAVSTQYIPFAPTIYINDYIDHEGVAKPGLRTIVGGDENLEKEYKNSLKKPIIFDKAGFLFLDKYANDPMLVLFLLLHDYNEDAPFRQGALKTIPFLNFKAVKQEVKRQKTMDSIVSKMDVIKDLASFYEKTDSGYRYDEIKIGALAKIFGVHGQFPNAIDQYGFLVSTAEINPEHFVTTRDNALNKLKMELAKAVSYRVLNIGKTDAKIVRNGKPMQICQVTSEENGLTDLCYFILGSKDGDKIYNEITDIIQSAQVAGAAVKA